jgi:hypothetical protein
MNLHFLNVSPCAGISQDTGAEILMCELAKKTNHQNPKKITILFKFSGNFDRFSRIKSSKVLKGNDDT